MCMCAPRVHTFQADPQTCSSAAFSFKPTRPATNMQISLSGIFQVCLSTSYYTHNIYPLSACSRVVHRKSWPPFGCIFHVNMPYFTVCMFTWHVPIEDPNSAHTHTLTPSCLHTYLKYTPLEARFCVCMHVCPAVTPHLLKTPTPPGNRHTPSSPSSHARQPGTAPSHIPWLYQTPSTSSMKLRLN